MIIIQNSKIENLLTLDEPKLFVFNRRRIRLYDRIMIKSL